MKVFIGKIMSGSYPDIIFNVYFYWAVPPSPVDGALFGRFSLLVELELDVVDVPDFMLDELEDRLDDEYVV